MFLSFIIPVYNTEAYLDECLQSLLNQDIPLENYELICVNDGSTDSSLNILRRYEREFENVKVIDQENGGVCRARNTGLRAATGDYVWFFDSDDVIRENSLGLLLKKTCRQFYDRIVVGQQCFVDVISEHGYPKRIFQDIAPWFDSVVSRSLLRREFLSEYELFFRYPDLRYGEDALMMYEIKRHMPTCIHIDDILYFYRIRSDSAVTSSDKRGKNQKLQSNIREAVILKEYYEKKDGILTEETANRFMSFLWGSLFRTLTMPRNDAKPYLKELKEKGLYPYRRPKECTLTKCPEMDRNDWLGKFMDLLYINLGSRWGYHGMQLLQWLFHMKEKIGKYIHK